MPNLERLLVFWRVSCTEPKCLRVGYRLAREAGGNLTRKACPICEHSSAKYVDHDLSSGYSVHHVSLKHFGDYSLVNALRRHKRSHRKRTRARDNVVTTKEWSMDREPEEPPRVSGASENDPKKPIIAVEAMRIKGVVYQAGESIPEALWTPAYLSAALRAGTVRRRKAS